VTITLILLTIGAVGVGRGLVRLLAGRAALRSAGPEVLAGVGVLLTAAGDLADPGTPLARAFSLASTVVLVSAIVVLARLDAGRRGRIDPPPRMTHLPRP